MPKLVDRDAFFKAVKDNFGEIETITRSQLVELTNKLGTNFPTWLTNDPANRAGRGVYALNGAKFMPTKKMKSEIPKAVIQSVPVSNAFAQVANASEMSIAALQAGNSVVNLVPVKANGYVPFGHFNDVRSIVRSNRFYPVYVTGLSGNGKTMMIEQVCAQEDRECVRVNVTIETDEDDLIGGFRLVDGRTVWQNGPVVVAMERGAVLLLDEVDLGSNKLMCLQPVLEGKPIYLKKINRIITPVPGFTVIATANTKGKGSDDGRFIGTNVMNEAFLERFSITLEQEYPPVKTESKILSNVLQSSGINDEDFVNKLVQWAEVIRKSFYEGAVSDIISTRRLVHICEAFSIFGQDRAKAIQLCLNRFDVDTKGAFFDLYLKLDETLQPKQEVPAPVVAPIDQPVEVVAPVPVV